LQLYAVNGPSPRSTMCITSSSWSHPHAIPYTSDTIYPTHRTPYTPHRTHHTLHIKHVNRPASTAPSFRESHTSPTALPTNRPASTVTVVQKIPYICHGPALPTLPPVLTRGVTSARDLVSAALASKPLGSVSTHLSVGYQSSIEVRPRFDDRSL